MYKIPKYLNSTITRFQTVTGETIEDKVERITENKEPIKDGAPEIFTERKDGVLSAYNIRTDRWEIAADAMDAISKNIHAKREERYKENEKGKIINLNQEEKTNPGKIGKPESTHGENGAI